MKGNSDFYLKRTQQAQLELRKLERARNKYKSILLDIEREITDAEEEIKKNLHCYAVTTAESPSSTIE